MNGHHQKRSYRAGLAAEKCYYSSGTTTTTTTISELKDDSRGLHAKQQSKLAHALLRLPSVDELEIIHPAGDLPIELEQMIQQQSLFYHLTNLDLSHLLQPQFMNDYIRKGSLIAVSLPTQSNDDSEGDIIAIDGRGRLILNVSKDTYETLGLTGRKSRQLASVTGQRFVIEIPLSSPSNVSGKPGFERIKACLSNWPTRGRTDLFAQLDGVAAFEPSVKDAGKRWDVVMCFVGEEGSVNAIDFPDSLFASGTKIKRISPTITKSTLKAHPPPRNPLSTPWTTLSNPTNKKRKLMTPSGVPTRPLSQRTSTLAREVEEEKRGMREWIGKIRLGKARAGIVAKVLDEEEYDVEEEGREDVEMTVLRGRGFFHPFAMNRVLQGLVKAQLFSAPTSANLVIPTVFSLTTSLKHPFSHLVKWGKEPLVGTNKRPNGKRVKRGRGRGEEEEGVGGGGSGGGGCIGEDLEDGVMRGVEVWLESGKEEGSGVGWSLWEWQ
ncbi:BQ2448_5428 [Microbotryum intermedium]|uniref:BQ2448_5428 protein n=1 Tax=Microbotryum intermedium TaxID=269621 RepID=A0A238F453_9BASI|nr:BQ2448_5428 [Microbotryum intermedium]